MIFDTCILLLCKSAKNKFNAPKCLLVIFLAGHLPNFSQTWELATINYNHVCTTLFGFNSTLQQKLSTKRKRSSNLQVSNLLQSIIKGHIPEFRPFTYTPVEQSNYQIFTFTKLLTSLFRMTTGF